MRWMGALAGAVLFGFRGGLLSSIIGAALGNWVEEVIREKLKPTPRDTFSDFSQRRQNVSPRAYVNSDYAILGCRPEDSNETLRKCYHEKVKQLHPDILRAQGVSEELIACATAQMARLNAAWANISKARNL